ncbi:MAG: 8-oxo-dGTP diphosphatase [Gammaproteobacteria bacterium]
MRNEVERMGPFDESDPACKARVLGWIDSGADLCRLEKLATPAKHFIAYCIVIDQAHILLCDHIFA